MLQNIVVGFIIFVIGGVTIVIGQTPAGIKPSVIMGDVVSVDEAKIVVNAKNGPVDAMLSGTTQYKRASAENPSLSAATPAVLTDISVGDKVVVTGILAADGKSLPARAVYLMSKADISQKNAKEAAEWKTRGVYGKVISADQQTNQITIEVRGLMGAATNVTLTPKADAKFRRYAQDSVKFSEAKDSSIAEVKAGDMLRALGDRSSDGTSFSAEELISGAFQTIAGTVKSVDLEKNEVVINELQTRKDVTVMLGDASVMKRFPAEMAERMAGAQTAAAGGARPVGQPGAATPQAGHTPGGQAAGGARPGMGGPRAGGIDDMMERFPDIKAADLKAGDMIALSSTKNGKMDRIKAIKLIAGVEPFLRAAQAAAGRGRGQQVEFNIPGLEGGIP